MTDQTKTGVKKKMKYLRRILTGIMIGIGGMVYINTMPGILAPFLFSIGLITVVLTGSELYTGRIGFFPLEDKAGLGRNVLDYLTMLLCNLLGAGLAGLAARYLYSANLTASGISVAGLVAGKAAQSPFQAFLLAIGCGMMMYIAVSGYKKTQNLLMLIAPVAVFILAKFDHCVADAFYIAYAGGGVPLWYLPVVVAGNTVGSVTLHRITKG